MLTARHGVLRGFGGRARIGARSRHFQVRSNATTVTPTGLFQRSWTKSSSTSRRLSTNPQPASKIVNQPGGAPPSQSSTNSLFGVQLPVPLAYPAGGAALLVGGGLYMAFSSSDEAENGNHAPPTPETPVADDDRTSTSAVDSSETGDHGPDPAKEDTALAVVSETDADTADSATATMELPAEATTVDDEISSSTVASAASSDASGAVVVNDGDAPDESDAAHTRNEISDTEAPVTDESSLQSEVPQEQASAAESEDETSQPDESTVGAIEAEHDATIVNWAGTHSVNVATEFCPASVEELETLIRDAHASGQKVRPVGNALSPNGVAFEPDGMVSLRNLDNILKIDPDNMEITVQAGARVSQVLEALKPHGLTLQNFSSIQEQQLGGWTQVAAHGTGASLPTVDEMITRLRIVTPAFGTLEVSETKNAALFNFVKVGVGALGVVSELTLKCIPQHRLHERSFVIDDMNELRATHADRLRRFRHVRYMWLPYTGKVVVVVSDPVDDVGSDVSSVVQAYRSDGRHSQSTPIDDPLLPLKTLLSEQQAVPIESTSSMSFADLRGELLNGVIVDDPSTSLEADDNIQLSWTKRINEAEAQFWEANSGDRVDDSTEILGFECGGSQWVLETAFPCGTREEPDLRDIDFVLELLNVIEANNIPAPCPIEQRWTARSSSYFSPAYSTNPDEIFSWVGIIMYLPEANEGNDAAALMAQQRRRFITHQFQSYSRAKEQVAAKPKYNGFPHWSKIEIGDYGLAESHDDLGSDELSERVANFRARYAARFPTEAFEQVRYMLDPKGILSNHIIRSLLNSKVADTVHESEPVSIPSINSNDTTDEVEAGNGSNE